MVGQWQPSHDRDWHEAVLAECAQSVKLRPQNLAAISVVGQLEHHHLSLSCANGARAQQWGTLNQHWVHGSSGTVAQLLRELAHCLSLLTWASFTVSCNACVQRLAG